MLAAGKHCFVEKPLAQSVADAERAVAAAAAADRILMVGHLLEYHPGVAMLKRIAADGELGDIHYIYSNRLNLGKLRADENALWSLGAHDVSVVLHLAEEEPYEVEARGEAYMRRGVEDVVFGFLRFPSGLAAHLHLSWLDPHKERRFTVVGSRRMATFDDMDLERKVTVYDKGFDEDASTYGEYITRSGDIWSPRVPNREPLQLECQHFVDCVREGRDAALGRRLGPPRRARARRAAGAPRRVAAVSTPCGRLTARPAWRWATASASGRRADRRARGHPRRHRGGRRVRDPGRRGARQAAGAGARLDGVAGPAAAARARRRRRRLRAARSCSPARRSARARSSATRPTCASARASAPAPSSAAARASTTTSRSAPA